MRADGDRAPETGAPIGATVQRSRTTIHEPPHEPSLRDRITAAPLVGSTGALSVRPALYGSQNDTGS